MVTCIVRIEKIEVRCQRMRRQAPELFATGKLRCFSAKRANSASSSAFGVNPYHVCT